MSLDDRFSSMDLNSDGLLSKEEVIATARKLSISKDTRAITLNLTSPRIIGLGLSGSLAVTSVAPASLARAQGIAVGSQVLSVAGSPVGTLTEFKKAIAEGNRRGDARCVLEYRPPPPSSSSGSRAGSSGGPSAEL